MEIILDRLRENEHGTFGEFRDLGITTIELPWLNNERRISCIPAKTYIAYRSYYNRGKYPVFELRDVEGRDEILIHVANTKYDILGCIGVGLSYGNVQVWVKDGKKSTPGVGKKIVVPGVLNSVRAHNKWMNILKDHDEITLHINAVPPNREDLPKPSLGLSRNWMKREI